MMFFIWPLLAPGDISSSYTSAIAVTLFDRLFSEKVITGSIARSATRRYLIYSEADFEVFRPAGATRCTDGGEIWQG